MNVGTEIVFTQEDIAYVREHFVPLDELCEATGRAPDAARADVAAGYLPGASYVLPDGAEMVPSDFFALADEAGGTASLHQDFVRRLEAAVADAEIEADAEEEWTAYLTGLYGVCLKQVSPESIVWKGVLMTRIEELLASDDMQTAAWTYALRSAVDDLDELERPFAPEYDRLRFGSPSSRDRLITAVRARYPAIFDPAATEGRST